MCKGTFLGLYLLACIGSIFGWNLLSLELLLVGLLPRVAHAIDMQTVSPGHSSIEGKEHLFIESTTDKGLST